MSTQQALGVTAATVAFACALAWAGSPNTHEWRGIAIFPLCGLLAFAINWAAFVPAYVAQTERYYDLTGTLTYGSVVAFALVASERIEPRSGLLAGLILVWAIRLGTFLFRRIRKDGSDPRFDAIKPNWARFLMTWTLQALWVFFTASCALAAMTARDIPQLGVVAVLGSVVFVAGFAIETIADAQKRAFRAKPNGSDTFITSGLWAWSRHPNYFGEILLWTGIAIVALPALSGRQHITLLSPVFVYVLLTRISGIPLLEAREKQRWGDDPDYQRYRSKTPSLIPRPPRAP